MRTTARYLSTAIAGLMIIGTSMSAVHSAQCCGDCNSNGSVSVDELVTAVNADLSGCVLPIDFRPAFLASPDVQSCAARLVADGLTAGEVETTEAIDSLCNTRSAAGRCWQSNTSDRASTVGVPALVG